MSGDLTDRAGVRHSAVPRTVFAVPKEKFSCADLRRSGTLLHARLIPADPHATEETAGLHRLLQCVSQSRAYMFGHQNAAHIGISVKKCDGTESDIKFISGSHPAVIGIDTLSFTGFEGSLDQMIEVTKQAHRENAVITLSMHAPNFALGGDQFVDYSPNVISPQIVSELMPGKPLNAKFCRYLDLIVEYCKSIKDDNGAYIPVIFRPFHENNGDWFWWGGSHCTPEEYRNLFRYTVSYLREEKGIRHFLTAYSPNGPFADEAEYLSRYPGDEYVDVIGYDMYHDRPRSDDGWIDLLVQNCRIVCSIAEKRGKVAAVTETGLRMLDTSSDNKEYEGLCPSGNPIPDWFSCCADAILSDPSAARIAYLLVWSNFSAGQFWIPYAIDAEFGHEMINEFTGFLNDPRILLAGQMSPAIHP